MQLYIVSCLYAELWMLFIAIIIVFIVFYVSVFIYGRDKEIYSIAKSRSDEPTRSDVCSIINYYGMFVMLVIKC